VPEVVVERLPLYVRVLGLFDEQGLEMVSSEQLGSHLRMTPAQIRKDLSYFGRFGKQGRGYNVQRLSQELRAILGLDRRWNACVVGVGRLGRAILNYPGFAPEGFQIVSAFDADESLVGQLIGDLQIEPLERIPAKVRELSIVIGIVAVPAAHAQEVTDLLVSAGIRSILNYAPITARAPGHVKVRSIDPVLSLQSMTYYLKRPPGPGARLR
jgi:redox-sensing transcriptional repressor